MILQIFVQAYVSYMLKSRLLSCEQEASGIQIILKWTLYKDSVVIMDKSVL